MSNQRCIAFAILFYTFYQLCILFFSPDSWSLGFYFQGRTFTDYACRCLRLRCIFHDSLLVSLSNFKDFTSRNLLLFKHVRELIKLDWDLLLEEHGLDVCEIWALRRLIRHGRCCCGLIFVFDLCHCLSEKLRLASMLVRMILLLWTF